MSHFVTTNPINRKRIHFLDELRGFVIILMVFFHGFYTVGWVFDHNWGRILFDFFNPSEPFFAGVFILLCGISCHLSHSNLRRGLLLALVAEGMSLFLWFFMPENMIWFGILQFLAVGILLFALLRPVLSKIPLWVGLVLCVVLYVFTYAVPSYRGGALGIPGIWQYTFPAAWAENWWLYPLGLSNGAGADYFPILPWIFVFFAGTFLGRLAAAGRYPAWMERRHMPWLSWIGRHSLIIYIVHQPIIFGICWIVEWLA